MAAQTITPQSLGSLRPLVSDLITSTAPKNHFLRETYSADPEAIQDRLGEYQFYDPASLGGLVNYFSPLAAASYKGNLVFKPSDFQTAQSNLYGLDSAQVQALKSPLQGYSSVGDLGGQTYYNKADISKALSGYGAIDEDKWNQYSDSTRSKFNPVTTINKQVLIRPEDIGNLRNVVGVEDYLSKINPLRTKQEIWTPDPALTAKRKWWDSTPLRPDPSLGYREIQGGDGSIWVRDVADPLSYEDFWSEYGTTPEGGWSDANTKYSGQSYLSRRKASGNPLQKWMSDTSYLPNFSLYGTGSAEDKQRGFNILQRMSPQNIGEFWSLSPDVQKGMLENPAAALQWMRATANPANQDWLSVGAEGGFSGFDAYKWDPTKGLTVDPSRYMQINDGGGGLFGSVFNFMDPILDKVDPLHNPAQNLITKGLGFDSQEQAFSTIMPMVVDYFVPGLGSGLSAANAASVGNWGGAVTGALGSYLGATGQGLNLTNNQALNQALTKAAVTGAGTAVSGGKLQDVMRNAALSGLVTYGGGLLGGAVKNASPLAQVAAKTGYGTLAGGLADALRGGSFNQGASNAARRGITNAAINAALNNQLFKG